MGARVLLAAESITLQELLPQDFISGEAEVTWVSDGISARQFIDDIEPDLLIAEVSLGGVNGFELCEYARESARHREMPVILVDSQFEALNQAQACKAGVDIYLAKPFEQDRIAGTVSKLVRRERADRTSAAPVPSVRFNESIPLGFVPEVSPSQSDSRYAKDRMPQAGRSEVRVEQAQGSSRAAPLQPDRARGGKRFPALLWVILIGLILGSLALLASRSTRPVEAPKPDPGVVSASDALPESGPAEEARSASSLSDASSSDATGSGARASDLPVVDEPVIDETAESPASEEAAHLPPLTSNSLATTTQARETPADSAPSATGRPFTHSVTAPPAARPAGRDGAGANFRRSGRNMRAAGKNIGSGIKHFGIASKRSAVWSGKKAGSGVRSEEHTSELQSHA